MVRNFLFNSKVLNIWQNLNCVRRICCAAGIILGTAGNVCAQLASIYTVAGIEVDRTADTATAARQQAIIDAHQRAFNLLLSRLVPADQRALLPILEHADIVPMVRSFGVDRERTSDVRYLGTLTFQFRRSEVRQFMRAAGVSFAETRSKEVLLLPVLDFGGAKLLWDVPNTWFEAWKAVPLNNRLVPLSLPVGDLADIRDIGAEQAVVGSREQISTIRERYGAATVIVAEALPDLISVPGQRNINVTLRYFGGAWEGRSGAYIFRVQDGETEAKALSRIAFEISLLIEEGWKLDNILELDSSDNLIAEISLNELHEWVEIRRRLAEIAFVKNMELVTLSRMQATVRLVYFGSPKQLKIALAQSDLDLSGGSMNWVLRDARGLSSASGRQIKTSLSPPRGDDVQIKSRPTEIAR